MLRQVLREKTERRPISHLIRQTMKFTKEELAELSHFLNKTVLPTGIQAIADKLKEYLAK